MDPGLGAEGIDALHEVPRAAACRRQSVQAPMPKSEDSTDGMLVKRAVSQLRPQQLKNTDAKVLAASCNTAMPAVCRTWWIGAP